MFSDYSEFADPLRLPVNGKVYEIPPVGIRDGLKITASTEQNTPLSNEDFRRTLLGDVYEQLLADNIPGPAFARIVLTALAEFQYGRATAEITWETGGDPKALQALKTREAEANTTPQPASGSGTSPKTKQSRSRTSSNTGS